MVDTEFVDSSIERFFFQFDFSTEFSSKVSGFGRLYFISFVNDLT